MSHRIHVAYSIGCRISGLLGGLCSACTAGTYKDAIGSAECTACAQNETSSEGSESADACVCEAGYGHEEGDPYAYWPMYYMFFRGDFISTWTEFMPEH